MKLSLRLLVVVLCVWLSLDAHAQPSLSQLQADMASAWLVTVEGDEKTRTLRIVGLEQKAVGRYALDAVYGMTSGNQTAVKAEIVQTIDEDRRLLITTQADSRIAASQKADGVFSGTFTSVSGQVKGVRIERISDADLAKQKRLAIMASGPKITAPDPDVPKECAAWSGGWVGDWQVAGYRNTSQLWVRHVDKDCNAYVAASGAMVWKVHNVKDGSIHNVLCNRETGGLCRFDMNADQTRLRANYLNELGGRNWAEFTRLVDR
jgi:hypothetical protein